MDICKLLYIRRYTVYCSEKGTMTNPSLDVRLPGKRRQIVTVRRNYFQYSCFVLRLPSCSVIVAEHNGVGYDSGHGFEQRDFTNSPMSEYAPMGEPTRCVFLQYE